MRLLKSFQLDKKIVGEMETQISCAERAGLLAKLAVEDGAAADNGRIKRIEDCKLATFEKASADAESAQRARASGQVMSRPSSSLSVAQALLDVDQVRASTAFARPSQ